jgi:hemoglobin-like flavoprotein
MTYQMNLGTPLLGSPPSTVSTLFLQTVYIFSTDFTTTTRQRIDEFYERLDTQDTSGRFDAVLSRNSSGDTKILAKGAILIRIVKFVIAIEKDSREVQYNLYMLGKSHSHKGIRPWQYTVFIQCMLLTLSSRLGIAATSDVMEAWVNVFAFVCKSMLPPAIENQVVETEINVNTSSEFASDRVAMECLAAEELKSLRRRNGGSAGTSAVGSPRGFGMGSPRTTIVSSNLTTGVSAGLARVGQGQ